MNVMERYHNDCQRARQLKMQVEDRKKSEEKIQELSARLAQQEAKNQELELEVTKLKEAKQQESQQGD